MYGEVWHLRHEEQGDHDEKPAVALGLVAHLPPAPSMQSSDGIGDEGANMKASARSGRSWWIAPCVIAMLLMASAAVVSAEPAGSTAKRVPDLQGISIGATLTPLERPPQLADKARFEPTEIAEQQRQATERFWGLRPQAGRGRPRQRCFPRRRPEDPAGRTHFAGRRAGQRYRSAASRGRTHPRPQPEQPRQLRR